MSIRAIEPTTRTAQVRAGDGQHSVAIACASTLVRDGSSVEAVSVHPEGGPPELIVLDLADRTVRNDAVPTRVRSLAQAYPGVPLVLVSGLPDAAEVEAAAALGVRGFINGTEPVRVAIAALRLVAAGGSYLPTSLDRQGRRPAAEPQGGGHSQLTPREIQVLREVATGASNRDIGERLGLSENTVKVYVRNLMRKMNARNRLEVAARADRAL